MLNPWAFIVVVIAIVMMIIAVKGTQDNVITAIKGKPYGNTTLN